MIKIEAWQLRQRQSLPLEAKIIHSQDVIKKWYEYWEGNVYVAFSGGKDSTVLLNLVRELYPEVPAVFVDTGLEYPEIREFVKTINNVIWLKPKLSFKQVIDKYGYPVISKEQSQYIYQYRTAKSEKTKQLRWYGDSKKRFKISDKWKYLVDAPFKISDQCCTYLKKQPVKKYDKETGFKPFIGKLADESNMRKTQYLRNGGCNAFQNKKPTSNPLSIWLEQDIWDYIHQTNIPYSPIYNMGYKRTGCMFCMFGCHLEKEPNKFQRMKKTHPQLYDYCINKLDLKTVLDYIHVKY